MDDEEFARSFAASHGTIANRHRYQEFADMFTAAGFHIVAIDKLERVEDSYLDDVLPRMTPHFQQMTREQLGLLSVSFRVRKA